MADVDGAKDQKSGHEQSKPGTLAGVFVVSQKMVCKGKRITKAASLYRKQFRTTERSQN
jgi:hypothetical protein